VIRPFDAGFVADGNREDNVIVKIRQRDHAVDIAAVRPAVCTKRLVAKLRPPGTVGIADFGSQVRA
jgi:hypothetical protein